MAEQKNILPSTLFAGESIVKTITGATVSGYTLRYDFNSQPIPVSVSCVSTTGLWVLTVSSAQSLLWARGTVAFVAYHTNSTTGAVSVIDYGEIALEASPMTVSQYQAALTAVEAAILSYASNPNKRINVDTINIEYKSYDELKKLRDFYKQMIAQETGRGYGGGIVKLSTRFV